MTFNNIFWLIPVSLLLSANAVADELSASRLSPPKEAEAVAQESLSTFRELVAAPNKPNIIAEGPGAAPSVTLGSPMQDSIIRLGELRRWDGKNPTPLIHFTDRLIYPIVTRNGDQEVIQSSMTLAQTDGKWTAVEFGSVAQAQRRGELKRELFNEKSQGPGGSEPLIFQVRVPALNAKFVASEENNSLTLASMDDLPSVGLSMGQKGSAQEILRKLQEFASSVEPGVPN